MVINLNILSQRRWSDLVCKQIKIVTVHFNFFIPCPWLIYIIAKSDFPNFLEPTYIHINVGCFWTNILKFKVVKHETSYRLWKSWINCWLLLNFYSYFSENIAYGILYQVVQEFLPFYIFFCDVGNKICALWFAFYSQYSYTLCFPFPLSTFPWAVKVSLGSIWHLIIPPVNFMISELIR